MLFHVRIGLSHVVLKVLDGLYAEIMGTCILGRGLKGIEHIILDKYVLNSLLFYILFCDMEICIMHFMI